MSVLEVRPSLRLSKAEVASDTIDPDVYGFLINFKYPWDQVQQRKRFYKYVLGAVFDSIGVPSASLLFIEESSYAFTPKHILDVYKLCALSSQQQLRATGDEVGASTMFGPMLTPALQALDEEYQKADFDFGGLDQVSRPAQQMRKMGIC